jgi:hypothetical protein
MNQSNLQKYLTEAQSLVSCPDKIYKQLYLSTLSHFITQCPANELKPRLKLSIAALKLRRGLLLPKNAGAEAIAAEEAQWTYALFSGALLKGLRPDVTNKIIPNIAESWLSKNTFLFAQWKDILLDAIKDKNDLNIIIQRALELSTI